MIINMRSDVPVYQQIIRQIKSEIRDRKLTEGSKLPSIRSFAREQQISALTVKKAYDVLEKEGIIVTVQGKGSFIAKVYESQIREELNRQIETDLETLLIRARETGVSAEEIRSLFDMAMEEIYDH